MPRSHDLRRAVVEEATGRDPDSPSVGLKHHEVNAVVRAIDADECIKSFGVYGEDTPSRKDMRVRLARLAGLDGYAENPGSYGRPFNNGELEAILRAVEEAGG